MSHLGLHPANHHQISEHVDCGPCILQPQVYSQVPHMTELAFNPISSTAVCAGLDANAALVVTQCISRLCTSGDHLVIASIHQPRAAIWDLFNRVVLLSEGYTLYCGPTADVRPTALPLGFAQPTWAAAAQQLGWAGVPLQR